MVGEGVGGGGGMSDERRRRVGVELHKQHKSSETCGKKVTSWSISQ